MRVLFRPLLFLRLKAYWVIPIQRQLFGTLPCRRLLRWTLFKGSKIARGSGAARRVALFTSPLFSAIHFGVRNHDRSHLTKMSLWYVGVSDAARSVTVEQAGLGLGLGWIRLASWL